MDKSISIERFLSPNTSNTQSSVKQEKVSSPQVLEPSELLNDKIHDQNFSVANNHVSQPKEDDIDHKRENKTGDLKIKSKIHKELGKVSNEPKDKLRTNVNYPASDVMKKRNWWV